MVMVSFWINDVKVFRCEFVSRVCVCVRVWSCVHVMHVTVLE